MTKNELEEYFKKKSLLFNLLDNCNDYLVLAFMDLDSDKMLDDKIEVVSQLNAGIPSKSIKKYYDVLELYPKEGVIWL